jgi:phosphatidylethanolamine-binding protein (PEBP) family uncharacterized protein
LSDPEGGGTGLVHWIGYGISPDRTSFAEGELSQASDKFVAGKADLGMPHYVGPCAPPGSPHHYTFILLATDLEPAALQPGLSMDEFKAAVKGHVKGTVGLVGLYSRQ